MTLFLRTFFYILCWIFFIQTAYAVDFSSSVSYEESDRSIKVSVFVDPGQESLNAYEGKIDYKEDSLFLRTTETAGSVVSQWLSFPERLSTPLGSDGISFEGITPGSFSGVIIPNNETKRQGLLFTLVFDGRQEGDTTITIRDVAVYRADGRATKIPLPDKKIHILITEPFVKNAVSLATAKKKTFENKESDALYASLETSQDLYDGKPFLVFGNLMSQKSPIKFEVSELPVDDPRTITDYSWTEAKSPYLLTQTSLSGVVHVRVTYSDGSYSYKTLRAVEKIKDGEEFSYILMTVTLFFITLLYVVYSIFLKKKTMAE